MSMLRQTFSFAPPQPGVQPVTQANPITNVPLDGSGYVDVPFLTPFVQYVKSVNVTYTPPAQTGYQITVEVLPIPPATTTANSLGGFRLVVTGGPVGSVGSFTYSAEGL